MEVPFKTDDETGEPGVVTRDEDFGRRFAAVCMEFQFLGSSIGTPRHLIKLGLNISSWRRFRVKSWKILGIL